jgi:hypothetical protein
MDEESPNEVKKRNQQQKRQGGNLLLVLGGNSRENQKRQNRRDGRDRFPIQRDSSRDRAAVGSDRAAGVSIFSRRPAAESAMSWARRRSRVAS